MIFIFSFALLIQYSFAAPTSSAPTCGGLTRVNPPNDLTIPYYWPANWNENQDAPNHTIHTACKFRFNVPKGLYAKLIMKGKMDGNAAIFLNDDANYNQFMLQTNLEPYFFVNDKFIVEMLATNKTYTGTLGLKVVWSKLPSGTPSKLTFTNGSIFAMPANEIFNGIVASTNVGSRVSLVPMPNKLLDYNSLRNTLVFDGPSYYANYVGNLYKFFISKTQFISTGSNLTLLTFEPQNTQDFYILQDYRDTMNISQYTAVACDDSMHCPVDLNASSGKAVAVSFSKNGETLESAYIEQTASLLVYKGVVSDSNLLDKYYYSSTITSLPRKYHVSIRQYVVDTGYAQLNISR